MAESLKNNLVTELHSKLFLYFLHLLLKEPFCHFVQFYVGLRQYINCFLFLTIELECIAVMLDSVVIAI